MTNNIVYRGGKEVRAMKQKKLIALGLSLGMMLNSLSVSAAEYVEVNPQSEEQEDFSSQSESRNRR